MHQARVDRVNLITQGQGWMNAPMNGECWGINDIIVYRPLTLVFHMHDLQKMWQAYSSEVLTNNSLLDVKIPEEDQAYLRPWLDNVCSSQQFSVVQQLDRIIKRLAELNIPLISVREYPQIPQSVRYPIEEIVEEFGHPYFTNTISYMLAYAIWQGFKDIYIYGAKMEVREELLRDKSNIEFWAGVARGRKINVVFDHAGEYFLQTQNDVLYGFDYARKYGQERDPYLRQRARMGKGTRNSASMGSK